MKKPKKLILLCILIVIALALVLRLENLLSAGSAYVASLPVNTDIDYQSSPPQTAENSALPVPPRSPAASVDPVGDPQDGSETLSSDSDKVDSTSPQGESVFPVESAPPAPVPGEALDENNLPDGFVYAKDIIPNVRLEIRYATEHNFTGSIVDGYESDRASLTLEAANALKMAADDLEKAGFGIRIYDAYRPKQAVDFFVKWSEQPEDSKTKSEFYPDYDKKDLFSLGYIARKSAHSRGSTIDLTLYSLNTGENLDMGSPYDFLGPVSNQDTALISEDQAKNRNILRKAMKDAGFKELKTEWWHYTLIGEPYPDTVFDFPVR